MSGILQQKPGRAALREVAPLPEDARGQKLPSPGERLLRPRTLLSVILAAVILYLVFRQGLGLDWREVWDNVNGANLALLVLALAVFYTSFYVRALRWKVLLANVGYGRKSGVWLPSSWGFVRIMYISWFVNCVTVARLGDVYRGYLLKRRARVSFAVTLGTILAERVLDLAVLAVMLSGSALIAFHGSLPSGVSDALAAGVAISVLGLAALFAVRRFGGAIERHLPVRARVLYERFARRGIAGSLRRLPVLIGYSVASWVIESATLYLVAGSVGVELSPWAAMMVALVASLLSVFPFTPSGLGVAEAGTVVALGWLGMQAEAAGTIVILDRLITYWSIVFFGLLVYLLGPGRSRLDEPDLSTDSGKEL